MRLRRTRTPGYVAPAYEVEALYDRLESAEAEVARLRAEPVLAPNALDASAERWQLYAAKLEVTLGELRGERGRLRELLEDARSYITPTISTHEEISAVLGWCDCGYCAHVPSTRSEDEDK